jgi:uncharacterized membrane protein YhaH (DUF805 family)
VKRLFFLYFSADGRISRKTWWLSTLALIAVEWAVLFLLGFVLALVEMGYFSAQDPQNAVKLATESVMHQSNWIGLGVAALFFLPSLQLGMKRRHDRRSAGADFLAFSIAGMFLEFLNAFGQTATTETPTGELPTAFGIGCLIYVLFALYMVIVLGCRRGVPGSNVYGPDPAGVAVRQPIWNASAAPSGAVTVVRSARRPLEVRTQNPILRYWQGGFPLGPSFWLVNVVVGFAFEIGLPLVIRGIDPDDAMDPAPRFMLLLASGAALAGFTIWLRVGVWRSAQRRAEERRRLGPNAFWPRLAQVLVVPPLLLDGLILYFIVVFAGVYFPIAFQGDPDIPDYAVSVLQDGKALSVVGGIKFGLAHDIEAALDGNPAVQTIYLQSPGGRLGAAEQVAQLITARGLNTYVSDHCESACTRIFVAGTKRLLQTGGHLGFHSGRTDADVPSMVLDEINQSFAAKYVAAGVDAAFMRRAEAVLPADMWYPTDAELIAAHVVTAVVPGESGGPSVAAPAAAPPPDETMAQNRPPASPHAPTSAAASTIAKDRH